MVKQSQAFSHIEKAGQAPSRHPWRDALKRAFDIITAVLGLVLLSPLMALIAIMVRRESPGPALYRGRRAARGGGEFRILKFRTMYENQHSYAGPKVTAQDDPRITPLGKWLRETKLNELPQLWNVLKGDMSVVGPRPEDPDIVATWPEEVRREILSVRPGITSPASVLYRDEEGLLKSGQVMQTYLQEIAPDKLRLDQLYVRHRSFLLDLDVLMWTLVVLIPRIGTDRLPEGFLFWGPISRFVKRYLNWFLIDSLLSLVSVAASGLIWRSFAPLRVGWPKSIASAVMFAAIFSICGSIFGVQRIEWSRACSEDALDLIPPTVLATIVALGLNFLLLKDRHFPVSMVLFASTLSFVDFLLVRYRSRLFRSLSVRALHRTRMARTTRERILILGGGKAGEMAAYILGKPAQDLVSFEVIGFVDDDLYKQGARIAGLPVLGQRQHLPELVSKYDIGIVVFAIHNISPDEQADFLRLCAQANVKVIFFPDFWRVLSATIGLNGRDRNHAVNAAPVVAGWPGIAPGQVDAWLAVLERTLQAGEMQDALGQISLWREQLAHSTHEEHTNSE